MDMSVFTMIAQWLGLDVGQLAGSIGVAATGVIGLTQAGKAWFPKVINNSRVLYVSAVLSVLPALVAFWPQPFGFRGILQGLFVGGAIFATSTGVWSGLKTFAHKIGTTPSNASGGAKPPTA